MWPPNSSSRGDENDQIMNTNAHCNDRWGLCECDPGYHKSWGLCKDMQVLFISQLILNTQYVILVKKRDWLWFILPSYTWKMFAEYWRNITRIFAARRCKLVGAWGPGGGRCLLRAKSMQQHWHQLGLHVSIGTLSKNAKKLVLEKNYFYSH